MTTRILAHQHASHRSPPAPVLPCLGHLPDRSAADADPRDQTIGALQRTIGQLQDRLSEATQGAEARVRLSLEAAGLGAWERNVRTGCGIWSPRMAELHGVTTDQIPSMDEWLARIDVADREAMHQTTFALLQGESDHFEASFRYLRPDGTERWIWSRGAAIEHDPATGRAIRIAGVSRDDTERRNAEARRDLLAREIDHRAKNALAVVQSVIKLTRADTVQGYARAVEGRIAALSRAHDILSRTTWAGAELTAILDHELAPFLTTNTGGRANLDGPSITLAPSAAQPLSMAIHELTTNAAKYGALSVPAGTLRVQWRIEPATGTLRLCWAERGGPQIDHRPGRKGFGTRVLDGTIRHQLGGTLQMLWEAEGLVCDIHIPPRQVAAVSARTKAADG